MSCQLEVIPTDKFKQVLDQCIPAIMYITNLSLETSEFCTERKEALVKSLIKKPSARLVKSNYRPVRNLEFISKIVERLTLVQFTDHCHQYSLLLSYQSAYRKFHSCKTSLVRWVNDLLWTMENQLITKVVILDLSAAFDMVDHNILLEVLEKWFGVHGDVRKWYYSYLKPREFKVNINN